MRRTAILFASFATCASVTAAAIEDPPPPPAAAATASDAPAPATPGPATPDPADEEPAATSASSPATAPPIVAASPRVDEPVARRNSAAQVTRDGTFLPTTLPARVGDHYVAALFLGGYETTPGQG